MITHYLKVAIRNLLKYKTQNLISIVGLAVGLFCFSVCFYISRFVGSVDKCFENHERIAEIQLVLPDNGRTISGISGTIINDLRLHGWQSAKPMYAIFFNDGTLFWGGILLGVTTITALTVIFRILKIARINPATIIKNE